LASFCSIDSEIIALVISNDTFVLLSSPSISKKPTVEPYSDNAFKVKPTHHT
jgi:hypothetical protein